MSVYTMELRVAMEALTGATEKEEYSGVDELISNARPLIFDFDYPIFDTSYKSVLESKILKYYYFHEICDIPLARWKLMLGNKMNEIMPYYNQLYSSEKLTINPLINESRERSYTKDTSSTSEGQSTMQSSDTSTGHTETDETSSGTDDMTENTQGSGTRTGETTSNREETRNGQTSTTTTAESSETGQTLTSDTPQGTITDVDDNGYLSGVQRTTGNTETNGTNIGTNSESVTDEQTVTTSENSGDTSQSTRTGTTSGTKHSETDTTITSGRSGTDTSTAKINTLDDYLEKTSGITGVSQSQLLTEYRNTFLNIDQMVLRELRPLFFLLY